MSSAYCVSRLLDLTNCDIALLCEHKLHPHSSHFMDSINQNYTAHTVTDSSLNNIDTYTRGKGGVSVIYKKKLCPNIRKLLIDSDHIAGVQICSILA